MNHMPIAPAYQNGTGLATAKRFVAEGAEATAIQGDIANLDDLDRLFAGVKVRHGHIDSLFANGGTAQV